MVEIDMKKFTIILAASALMMPAAAQAGHTHSNCGSSTTMSVQCERGVTVYRAKPLQYAPGQLQAFARADEANEKNRRLTQKLAFKSQQLSAQRKDNADLERRVEKLENRHGRRIRSSQTIFGTGFGAGFLSPQRAPGFRNGFVTGRGNQGRRGRRGHK